MQLSSNYDADSRVCAGTFPIEKRGNGAESGKSRVQNQHPILPAAKAEIHHPLRENHQLLRISNARHAALPSAILLIQNVLHDSRFRGLHLASAMHLV